MKCVSLKLCNVSEVKNYLSYYDSGLGCSRQSVFAQQV